MLSDEFFITYTALSEPAFYGNGNRIGLASTKDFSRADKHGIIGPDLQDKDAALFPDEINGKIGLLHRIEPNIQIIYFDDIEQLKKNHEKGFFDRYIRELDKHTVLERKYAWESVKVGAGTQPVKTKEGWLLIYHGVDKNRIYRAGAALLDIDNPQRVIARSSRPVLEPETEYEKTGDVPNVVFPEGAVVRGDELFVYYGASDKRCCLATCKLDDIIDYLLKEQT